MNQKPTGIVRKVDDLGRVVLPSEMRRVLQIVEQDAVDIQLYEDCILIKKHTNHCIFCGATEDLRPFSGKYICPHCLHKIRHL